MFEQRSRAARKGWEKRRVARELYKPLEGFIRAREAGLPFGAIRRKHDTWIAAQWHARATLEDAYRDVLRDVLDQIGEALGLDDDFIQALAESPDGEGA